MAKELRFGPDARSLLLAGVDQLAQAPEALADLDAGRVRGRAILIP